MMFSKERNRVPRQVAKATFKAQSSLLLLLQHYAPLRPKIHLLFGNDPPHQDLIDQVITISQKLPKTLERSTLLHQELQVCRELSSSLEQYMRDNGRQQSKPYVLFLLWKQFQDSLVARIKANIRGRFEKSCANPDTLKLISFVQELQQLTVSFEEWANDKAKNLKQTKVARRHNHNKSVQLIYPEPASKTTDKAAIGTTNRDTAASTAFVSPKASKHSKHSTLHDLTQGNDQNLLFRASTAKLERKELKMSVRCPSAVQLIQEQSFKEPVFELKRVSRRSKQQSMESIARDSADQTDNELPQYFSNFKPSKFRTKDSMPFPRGNTFHEDAIDGKVLEELQEKEKQPKNRFHVSIKAIEPDNELSLPEPQTSDKLREDQLTAQIAFLERSETRKATNFSEKRNLRLSVQSSVNATSSSDDSFEEEQQEYKIKKLPRKVTYRKVRRSGKYLVKENDTWVDVSTLSKKKSRHGNASSRRRIAVMPPNGGSLADIKSGVLGEDQLANEKRIEFEENVFLAVADVLKSNKKINTKRPETAKKASLSSFSNIMADLQQFLQGQPFQGQTEWGSVFFKQQEKVRQSEDETTKERIRTLMREQSQCSKVFEMGCRSSSKKEAIFSQLHRNECFQSDEQWIRHMLGAKAALMQKPI